MLEILNFLNSSSFLFNVDFNSFVRATNRLNDLETQAQQLSGKLDSSTSSKDSEVTSLDKLSL